MPIQDILSDERGHTSSHIYIYYRMMVDIDVDII